jgi:carbonic anhydrase
MRRVDQDVPRFASGVMKFQEDVYPEKRGLFEKLSQGQAPEALFITCSDSRIETAMLTQTDPGELFVCRNAGNIVPPHTNQTGGITASIEFAVSVLKVPHIVICGHTECGAMKGALNPEGLESLPHVKEWLGFSRAAVQIVDELIESASSEERMDLLLDQNVMLQIAHLRTHPCVAAGIAKGDITLHGWVYDIKTGAVRAWNDATRKFEPFANFYGRDGMGARAAHECAA